jgi:AraC-like DNA-binding protein
MEFISRRPAAPLDDWVDLVWLCRGNERDVRQPRALERVLPSGAAQLIVNLAEDETRIYEESPSGLLCQRSPGSILSGLRTRYQVIDTDEQAFVAGVVFRPGGTVPFVPAPALDLSDADVPLESLWGRQRDRLLREQLLSARDPQSTLDVLEAALLDSRREKAAHPAVGYALSEFRAHPSIARVRAVTDAIGLSPKRFIERFKADVGVTPKRYCRLLRFQRVVTRAHRDAPADWAELALACGYFDQAHLIHDFRAFSGLTPTAYEARRTGFQNHVTFLQSADR